MTEAEVKKIEKEYKAFMEIDSFPHYSFELKSVSLERADIEGFDSVAQSKYKPETQEHTLIVADNLIIEPYILFHEFTHILDAETYACGDKVKYVSSSGFTEYHASQIELLKMLGAKSVNEHLTFSTNKMVMTIAENKTVQQYIDMKRNHAIELFSRKDFPKDIEQLKTAMGVLFNYWGLRSICYMYCTDYREETDNRAFLRYISSDVFQAMNKLMVGWLSDGIIDICCKGYWNMIYPLIQEYKLA